MAERSVPFNNDAENYVLGSILIDNNIMNAVVGRLDVNDFYDQQNKIIYQAMLSLFKNDNHIEPLTIEEEMRRLKLDLPGDVKTILLDLIDQVPATSSANLYIDVIKQKAVERELLNNMKELSEDILTSHLEYNSLLDKAEDKIINIVKKRRTGELLTIEKAAKNVYDEIERYSNNKSDIRGIPTGFPRLDRATLGFQKGDLIILAARPSVGKSAYALNLALNTSKRGTHVAFFSLEMSVEQLMMRLFSYESNIPMSKIRRGDLSPKELILLGRARQDLMKHHIYFDESNSSDINEIRSKCRQLKQMDKLDFVIIDYLQLISVTGKGSRQEEVAAISRALKILAKELEVPIIALSQLSRMVEVREDKRPVLSDLRESGSIEQDADIVMFLYRPEGKKEKDGEEVFETKAVVVDASTEKEDNWQKKIELIIAKNRQGSLRDIEYTFYPEECRFNEAKYTIQEQRVSKQNQEAESK